MIVYTISHCGKIAQSMFYLIHCLPKLTVCCITNWKAIQRKHFCVNSEVCWEIFPQYTLLTNCTRNEKLQICICTRQVQQTVSAALKKNQERRFEGNETDPFKVDKPRLICYIWVPGYWKWQRQTMLRLRKREYFLFEQDLTTIILCRALSEDMFPL